MKEKTKSDTPAGAVAPAATCYALRPTRWSLYPENQGSMSEHVTVIEVDDEGAGEFLVIKQPFARVDFIEGGVAIDPIEWPKLRDSIDAAFASISEHNAED